MSFKPTLALAEFLVSAVAKPWLVHAATLPIQPETLLRDLDLLRHHLSPDEAAAVVEQVQLRRRAASKFSRAAEMFFTREALEQATRTELARHRAGRFAGRRCVADLGCGIGGDTLALADVAEQVWGFDTNPVRLLFAQENAAVYNRAASTQFTQADVLAWPVHLPHFDAIFADPARRITAGRRVFSAAAYQPPLSHLLETHARCDMAIKLGPGLNFDPPLHSEVEFVSFAGEAKEAVLWTGTLATPGVSRRATCLPGSHSLTNLDLAECPVASPGAFLYEPDPAIIRAGLVEQLGYHLGLTRVDEHIAYLSGPQALASPLVRGYHIEATLPLQRRRISAYLQSEGIAQVDVKQRGTGIDPETFQRQLKKAKGGSKRTLILVRLAERHLAFVCSPLTAV